jgi:hypothetical protein
MVLEEAKGTGKDSIYKEPTILSGIRAAIWSKLTLGLLATITLEVVPFCAYTLFPALLPFSFKCILEVVFREDVQPPAILPQSSQCQNILSFSFNFNRGNRKVRDVWDDSQH